MIAPHDQNAEQAEAREVRRQVWKFMAAAILLIAAAFLLRMGDLSARPMHGDEGVNAWKLAELLWQQNGRSFHYDPHEYHGPLLWYLAAPLAKVLGAGDFTQLTESVCRWLSLLLGVGVVALTAASARRLGKGPAWMAAAVVAVSPAMIFFSRYFIHEMLLVAVTGLFLLSLGEWLLGEPRHRWRWAVLCGASVGLMHATKETFVLSIAAAGCAVVGTWFWENRKTGPADENFSDRITRSMQRGMQEWQHFAMAAVVAVMVSVAIYSEGFTYGRGPVDSVATYAKYLERSGIDHQHPWYAYVQRLLWWRQKPGPVFSEGGLMALMLAGAAVAAGGWGLSPVQKKAARFVLLYAAGLAGMYSTIRYKTPWSMLVFVHGFALLAGIGAWALLTCLPGRWVGRGAGLLLVAAALGQLLYAANQVNGRFVVDARNPYVYGHPLRPVVTIESHTRRVAAVSPDGAAAELRVYDQSNYWPLPYYCRHLKNIRFFREIPDEKITAPMLLIHPLQRDSIDELAGTAYRVLPIPLRPHEERLLYVREDLWKKAEEAGTP